MNLHPNCLASCSPSATKVVSESPGRFEIKAGTFCADFAFRLQVAFVSDYYDGEIVLVFDSQNLLLECQDFLKALTGGYAIDEEKAFAGAHVLLAHGTVFLLAGGVEDIKKRNFLVNNALLPV